MNAQTLPDAVRVAMAQALGAELTWVRRFESGSRRRTFLVGHATQEWVARLARSPAPQLERSLVAQRLAGAAGLPAPKILAQHTEGASPDDYLWVVEERLRGRNFDPEKMGRAARLAACADVGRHLRRLHAIEVNGFGRVSSPYDTAEFASLAQWLAAREANIAIALKLAGAETASPAPILGAYRFLRESYTEAARLCHGDCAGENLLVDGEHVTGIVDWEEAHGGDPASDVAYFYVWHRDRDCLEALLSGYDPADPETFRRRVLAYLVLIVVELNVFLPTAAPDIQAELLIPFRREFIEILKGPSY